MSNSDSTKNWEHGVVLITDGYTPLIGGFCLLPEILVDIPLLIDESNI